MIGVFLFLVLACFAQDICANQSVTVSTKDGDVLGYQTDIARVFYGIPFAKPPVNDLRYI
jgi:acetylcholinesterase/neuroligin